MASVLLEDQCLIPGQISSLADFRRWSLSGDFPASGRIDWVASQIEVDTSPAACQTDLWNWKGRRISLSRSSAIRR
jgi:hypothetical protein